MSDGAVSFYLDHFVRSRIAKVTYGVHMRNDFDSSDPEHLKRISTVYADADGILSVGKGFDIILLKVCCDSANKTYSSIDNECQLTFRTPKSQRLGNLRSRTIKPAQPWINATNYQSLFTVTEGPI